MAKVSRQDRQDIAFLQNLVKSSTKNGTSFKENGKLRNCIELWIDRVFRKNSDPGRDFEKVCNRLASARVQKLLVSSTNIQNDQKYVLLCKVDHVANRVQARRALNPMSLHHIELSELNIINSIHSIDPTYLNQRFATAQYHPPKTGLADVECERFKKIVSLLPKDHRLVGEFSFDLADQANADWVRAYEDLMTKQADLVSGGVASNSDLKSYLDNHQSYFNSKASRHHCRGNDRALTINKLANTMSALNNDASFYRKYITMADSVKDASEKLDIMNKVDDDPFVLLQIVADNHFMNKLTAEMRQCLNDKCSKLSSSALKNATNLAQTSSTGFLATSVGFSMPQSAIPQRWASLLSSANSIMNKVPITPVTTNPPATVTSTAPSNNGSKIDLSKGQRISLSSFDPELLAGFNQQMALLNLTQNVSLTPTPVTVATTVAPPATPVVVSTPSAPVIDTTESDFEVYIEFVFKDYFNMKSFNYSLSQFIDPKIKEFKDQLAAVEKYPKLLEMALEKLDKLIEKQVLINQTYPSENHKTALDTYTKLLRIVNPYMPSVSPDLQLKLKIKAANILADNIGHADFCNLTLSKQEQLQGIIETATKKENDLIKSLITEIITNGLDQSNVRLMKKMVGKDSRLTQNNKNDLRECIGKKLAIKDWNNTKEVDGAFGKVTTTNFSIDSYVKQLKRIAKTKAFFTQQSLLAPSNIVIPRWYHATKVTNIDPILKDKEIKVLHHQVYKGAWVSSTPEITTSHAQGFGTDCFAFDDSLHTFTKSDVFIGYKYDNKRWRGLQKPINLTTHLRYLGVSGGGTNLKADIKKDKQKYRADFAKRFATNTPSVMSIQQLQNIHQIVEAAVGSPNMDASWWG